MAYKYLKYFIVLVACWCCTSIASAQTDSTGTDDAVSDTTYVATDSSSTYGDSDGNSTGKSALNKFSLKQPQGTVAERKLPASAIKQLKEDDDFWYRDKKVGKEKPEKEKQGFWSRLFSSKLFRVIFWILIIAALLGIIVVYIANSGGWLFARRGKRITARGGTTVAAETDNIFAMDFDARINQALSEFNYRLATRLLFLRVLRKMSEKNIIQYSIDKTNMDYMFELGNTAYFKDFAQASRTYEYVWYGNFDVQQNQFSAIRQRLDDFNQKLST
jgi:hypothetical protein